MFPFAFANHDGAGGHGFSARTRTFYLQFTESAAAAAVECRICHEGMRLQAMLNWLTANCELFGLPGQNWMLVVGGGLLLYIAALVNQPGPARGYPLAQAGAHAPQSRRTRKPAQR